MWKFFKRQLKTKTGKFGAAIIAGAIANAVTPEHSGTIMQIANQIFTPETGTLALGYMLLRDKEAKREAGEL